MRAAGRADNGRMSVFLETGRLRLRRFAPGDADRLYELDSDPEVMRYINGGQPTPRAEVSDDLLPFLLACYDRFPGGLGYWAAEARSTGDFLGWFQFRPVPEAGVELGYRLRRAAWHAGYATEGSRALVRKGFAELGADRVFASTMAANVASRRVMEKCGLVFERTFATDRVPAPDGSPQDAVEYALTRAQWRAGPGAA
jgi:RimJ/RimL family protein N-acetyltransferase